MVAKFALQRENPLSRQGFAHRVEKLGVNGDSSLLIHWPSRTSEILWTDGFDLEPANSLAHGLQHFFDRRWFAFDPAQRVYAGHHE